jgi:large conductance mechanosensitive channel
MSMLKGFRNFIARGNIVDLATAVIIGVAFGAIVDSLVKDIITPIIGMLGGQPDFSNLKIGAIGIGNFLNAVIAFLIKAAAVYFFVVVPLSRVAARLAAPPPPAPPTPSELYLKEIRDLLAKRA